MIEVFGSLWDYPADARCITTNGIVTVNNNKLVMGGGCAREARDRFPVLPEMLGNLITTFGNHCWHVKIKEVDLVSFPTKNHWRDPSDLQLIRQSAHELMEIVERNDWDQVVLPRPGTGLGGLNWREDVVPVVGPILDQRVHVITFAKERH